MFSLGLASFEQGTVSELKTRGKKSTATVKSDKGGHVQLHYTATGIEGSCDCPESDGIDFCEHCVAGAMALRAKQSKPPLKKGAKPVEVLTAYFERQSKEDLLKTLVQVVSSDKELRQKWLLQADTALGRLDKSTLRKRITSAIPFKKSIQRYHRVRKYFADLEKALTAIKEPLQLLPADQQLELVAYAIERLDKTTDTIDDSGGYRYPSLDLLQQIHFTAFSQLSWSEQKKAEHLVEILKNNEYGFYGAVPEDYQAFISQDCLDSFYKIVRQQWDALPPWEGGDWHEKRQYSPLLRVLERQLNKDADIAELIQLREKVAEDDYDFADLARLYLELSNYTLAQKSLDRIKHPYMFGTADVKTIQQEILLATGNPEEALERQWTAFTEIKDLDEYRTLKDIAVRSGDVTDWYQKSETYLKQKTASIVEGYIEKSQRLVLVNLLGWIYHEENDFDKLWDLANHEGLDPNLLRFLGVASKETPERTLLCYSRIIDFHVNAANNDRYRIAIELLKELRELLPEAEHAQAQANILRDLRVKHKVKRNFISWLNDDFPLEDVIESNLFESE